MHVSLFCSYSQWEQWEQLRAVEKEASLKLVPNDEIEREILVLQNALLSCAEENRCQLFVVVPQPTDAINLVFPKGVRHSNASG